MSAFDALFTKGFFRASKCKTLLKLTLPRIKLLRNRREMQIKQMRKDIAKLLETGQEATARIRVEHIIREENITAAQEILELFCELITVRLPIIEMQRECPLDLKEAISSICFAAPRCADLPELQQVQMQFAAKYGKEFVTAASELLPDCGVNRQIIEFLSVRAPSAEAKIKLLKDIAEEHDVDWDPSPTELELLKPPEDLLNGPGAFVSGSTLPLPKEKHSESWPSPEADGKESEDELDAGLESLDLPEVPKATVIAAPAVGTTQENILDSTSATAFLPQPDLCQHTPPTFTVDVKEQPKQFVPFVSSLPTSAILHRVEPHHDPVISVSPPPVPLPLSRENTGIEPNRNLLDALTSAQLEDESAEITAPRFSIPSQSLTPPPVETDDDDLRDVLTAAQAAAETAERAAAAARAAASLAQVRITELTMKRNGKLVNKCGIEDVMSNSIPFKPAEKHVTVEQHSPESNSPSPLLHELASTHHQPARSPSLEDDPYFSYPNLFSRQISDLQSPRDNSP